MRFGLIQEDLMTCCNSLATSQAVGSVLVQTITRHHDFTWNLSLSLVLWDASCRDPVGSGRWLMPGGLFGVLSPESNLGESGGAEAAAFKLGAERSWFICCCSALYVVPSLFACQTCRRPSPSSTTASRNRPWTTGSCTWTRTRTGCTWVARTTSSPWTSTTSPTERSRSAALLSLSYLRLQWLLTGCNRGHRRHFTALFLFPKWAPITCKLAFFCRHRPLQLRTDSPQVFGSSLRAGASHGGRRYLRPPDRFSTGGALHCGHLLNRFMEAFWKLAQQFSDPPATSQTSILNPSFHVCSLYFAFIYCAIYGSCYTRWSKPVSSVQVFFFFYLITLFPHQVFWPASTSKVEECQMAGKDPTVRTSSLIWSQVLTPFLSPLKCNFPLQRQGFRICSDKTHRLSSREHVIAASRPRGQQHIETKVNVATRKGNF